MQGIVQRSKQYKNSAFIQFSNDILGQQIKEKNILYSPINIQMALQMSYLGANNQTKQEMKHALSLQSFTDEQIHKEMGEIQNILKNNQSQFLQIKTANKVFCDHSIELNSVFQNQLQTYYNSQIGKIDFSQGEQAVQTINKWVENQTENKIQNLLVEVDPQEKLVLVSAIYFKGIWKNQFKQMNTLKKQPFNSHVVQNQFVDLMYQENLFKYYKTKDYQLLEMQYKDQNFSMVLILPNKNLNFQQFQDQFNKQSQMIQVLNQINSIVEKKVQVYVPKFQLTYKFSLKKTLQNLGMIETFEQNKADFSNMESKEQLFISDVIHKAFIEVNEEGSEAAAATAIIMRPNSCVAPKQLKEIPVFRADRSFLYCIKENKKQNILFVGNYMGNQ